MIESEAYRSKNPKLKQLRKYIKEYNIKNCSELEENTQPKSQKIWLIKMDVDYIHVPLSAVTMITAEQLEDLYEVFDRARKTPFSFTAEEVSIAQEWSQHFIF